MMTKAVWLKPWTHFVSRHYYSRVNRRWQFPCEHHGRVFFSEETSITVTARHGQSQNAQSQKTIFWNFNEIMIMNNCSVPMLPIIFDLAFFWFSQMDNNESLNEFPWVISWKWMRTWLISILKRISIVQRIVNQPSTSFIYSKFKTARQAAMKWKKQTQFRVFGKICSMFLLDLFLEFLFTFTIIVIEIIRLTMFDLAAP